MKITKTSMLTLVSSFSFGLSFAQTDIINGGTMLNHVPYMVSIEDAFGSHGCGGIILSDRWILTATHCFTQGWTPTAVHAGSKNQTEDLVGQRISVETIYSHPQYAEFGADYFIQNDVGLLYLSESLIFNAEVQPLKYASPCWFPNEDSYLSIGSAFLTGWGQTEDLNGSVPIIKGAFIPVISVEEANDIYQDELGQSTDVIVTDQELPFFDGSTGSAQGSGDSGGPYRMRIGDNLYAVGIVSWSVHNLYGLNGLEVRPSVAAEVAYHADWIESICGFSPASAGVDLYMKDQPWDMAYEPSEVQLPYLCDDIWIRNQPDGFSNDEHQNPVHDGINPSYVYVRVRNNGCQDAQEGNLTLYWAKASTALSWPNFWNGSMTLGGNPDALAGDMIGMQPIGVIEAGGSKIYEFAWNPPDPSMYNEINNEPWHFCLLARVESTEDPISSQETSSLADNVWNNNNIAWKNLTVIDFTGLVAEDHYFHQGTVSIGNGTGTVKNFDFYFNDVSIERTLLTETEVVCEFDVQTWNKLISGNIQFSGFKVFREGQRALKMTSPSASLNNIPFSANELGWINMKFNFLTRTATENEIFHFDLKQVNSVDGKLVGGERYVINKRIPERNLFQADGGGNVVMKKNETVVLQAVPIGESAEYSWYDQNGALLHSGMTYAYQSDSSAVVSLEVIADIDGYKDYQDINLVVKPHSLTSIVPNPSSGDQPLQVYYEIDDSIASSAYVQIVNASDGSIHIVPLNTTSNMLTVLPTDIGQGNFSVLLVVDGVVHGQLNLLVL